MILYLLLPPTSSRLVSYARYPIFGFNVYWAFKAIRECRSAAVSTAYGIGLLDGWAILWLAAVLLFDDGRKDFQRIEWAELVDEVDIDSKDKEVDEKDGYARKPHTDGEAVRQRHTNSGTTTTYPDISDSLSNSRSQDKPKFVWQSLPHNFLQRLDWVADLVSNFRLIGWTHQISAIPSPPRSVLQNLNHPRTATPPTVSSGTHRYPTTRALLRAKLTTVFLGYLGFDILKCIMMQDPYFWGLIESPPPAYLPLFITSSVAATKIYRLVLSLTGVYVSLETIMALAAPFFVGLVGPRYLGLRAAPWQYPDIYGSYGIVLRKGLAGWWGGWWHQTFRFAFEAPTRFFVSKFGWAERGTKAKMLGLVIAFGSSALLHASGSSTMWASTRPFKGPGLFFALQPVGIVVQMGLSQLMVRLGITDRLPGWVRQVGNFVVVHIWFYYTAPFFTDDVARGGIWLFEPVPISFWRGLGYGLKEEGWWQWNGKIIGWHTGKRWWQSGISF